MKRKRYEGSAPVRSAAEHDARAPWPTCSCLACFRARELAHKDPDVFQEAVDRWKGKPLT